MKEIEELSRQNPNLALKALRELLIDCYRDSLFATCKLLLNFKDIKGITHGPIIRALECETKRKLICVPRGCFKSTIACVSYPIWLLLRNPNVRILIDSELYTNSKTFLREIKAHLQSPELTELFGEFKSSVWNESEIIIKQRTKKLKEASITVGGIGTTKVGQHYDFIIHDDMNSPENSSTPEACQKVINHYKYNLSILEPQGIMVIIGTRYSEADLIGHILRQELNIDGIPTSGEYEFKEAAGLI